MKLTVSIILYSILLCTSQAQDNYFDYHEQIVEAEVAISEEDFTDAIDIYKSIIEDYDYVFVKDLLIASQIALINSEEDLALQFIEKAIIAGYDCDCIEKLPLFKGHLDPAQWNDIKSKSELYKAAYDSTYHKKLHHEFHFRYKQEQENKSNRLLRQKYRRIVDDNVQRIQYLMDTIPFPSERIIGLDDGNLLPTTQGGQLNSCEAGNSKVISILIHYSINHNISSIDKIGLSKFIEAIKSGHLHPRQFASIHSFNRLSVKRVNNNKAKNSPNLQGYYFNFGFDKKIKDLARVNEDRAEFGICSLEVEKKMEKVAQKYKLRLSYGYK